MTSFEHTARRTTTLVLALATVGAVGLCVLVSACGGGGSGAKVAQIGTTSSGTDSRSSSNSGSGDARKFSACMRSHGVGNFPDPDSSGRIKITSGVSANGQKTGVDVHSPGFDRARKACDKLLPNGGRPTAAEQVQEQQQMLKFAQCMRSHGIDVPDPSTSAGGGFGFQRNFRSIDRNSPQFQAASKACSSLRPKFGRGGPGGAGGAGGPGGGPNA